MNLLQCQKITTGIALLISELPNQTCIILVAQYSTLQDLMPGMLCISLNGIRVMILATYCGRLMNSRCPNC